MRRQLGNETLWDNAGDSVFDAPPMRLIPDRAALVRIAAEHPVSIGSHCRPLLPP
jgi:hypothetical protein